MNLETQPRLNQVMPKCKTVIVGDQSVGKSSIIRRYTKKDFLSTKSTVGIDFISKVVMTSSGKQIRLQIWDTAGQQRFRSLIPGYLKQSGAAMIVFDLTNQHSFQSIGSWIDSVKDSRGNQALIFLVANKCDLQEPLVCEEQMKQVQERYGIRVHKVSALSGEGVQQLFVEICQQLQKKYGNTITSLGDTVRLMEESSKNIRIQKKNQCCSA